ncbi:unnamed protein product [Paramecium primaurelia]|uniref:Transmembrane protein n=1 Tax=Paramecium primaurelia TaxID=5886 RepID=A0A8S1KQA5_PARPR|nr:unnamed protein product [Paramecium primaurelia]CAD8056591.1 unnamed protein product [Paramecium primaurelia]
MQRQTIEKLKAPFYQNIRIMQMQFNTSTMQSFQTIRRSSRKTMVQTFKNIGFYPEDQKKKYKLLKNLSQQRSYQIKAQMYFKFKYQAYTFYIFLKCFLLLVLKRKKEAQ